MIPNRTLNFLAAGATAAFALTLVLVHLSFAAPQSSDPSEDPELDAALAEMRAIEAEIETVLLEQASRTEQMEQTGEALESATERLRAEETLRSESEERLDELTDTTRREVRRLQLLMQAERERVARARNGAYAAAALRLYDADHTAANSDASDADAAVPSPSIFAPEPAPDAALHHLTLTLLQRQHRTRAQTAVDEMLRLESTRDSRQDETRRLTSASRRYTLTSAERVDELRRRHREVAQRLERLRARAASAHGRAAQLTEQRAQLDSLIRGLDASEAAPADRRDADLARNEISLGLPHGPETGPLSILPDEAAAFGGNAAASPARAASRATPPAPGGGPMAFTEGHRWIFWRARSSRVRALAQGDVLFSGKFAGYRHLLIVDHGGGWATVYGNLSAAFVAEDDTVGAGDVVGQYQAEAAGEAEPFWVEVRHDSEAVPIDSLPMLADSQQSWVDRLFGAPEDL